MNKSIIALLATVFILLPSLVVAQVIFPNRGGTGTSVAPTKGYVLVGNSSGTYGPVATSSLGITATADVTGDWTGTFDGYQATDLLSRANHTGSQLAATISDFVATVRTAISETISGIDYNNSTGVLSLTSGFSIPLTASTTQWQTAFGWGNHATQGYLTGNQTVTLSGDVSGSGATSITATVANDSHDHTGSTISGIDISSDTNLTGDSEVVLTGDSLSLASSVARDSELHSAVTVSGTPNYITLSGQDLIRGTVDVSDDTNLTAGDALTLTGDNIDFDGGATPAGELGGTWASPTIDDSLAVTSWNLTTPTFTSFFGTPCVGNQFLQDIGDTGSFSCATPTGGSAGSIGTSTAVSAGNLAHWTSASTLSQVATGTLTETATGLEFSATRGLIGGASILSLTTGYQIPTTTRMATWDTAFGWGNHSSAGYLSSASIDTSAELKAILTDETGSSGAIVFADSPTLTGTPVLPSTFTIGASSFIRSGAHSLTLTTSGSTNVTLPTSGTVSVLTSAMTGTFDGNNFGGGAIGQGELLYGSAAGTIAELAKDTNSTRYLSNQGTSNNPSWNQVNLTNGVTGTLAEGNGGTGITSFGTGIATWLGTPSSANFFTAVTGETGSGAVVGGTSPTIASPTLTSFFGTPCTGNQFLQDIGDTGTFSCATAAGGGGGLATSTAIADTYIIYGTAAGTVGAEAAFTYDDATNILTAGTFSGSGASLTALDGEQITDDTIDDDSIDFSDVTLADLTFDVGSVDTTEFGYLNGVTSAIQTQFTGKQDADSDLTTYAGITPSANVQSWLGAADYAAMVALIESAMESALDTLSSLVTVAISTTLQIPYGTSCDSDADGEICHDTTDNQLIVDGLVVRTTEQVIFKTTIASTSSAFINAGLLKVPTDLDGFTLTAIRCSVQDGTSKVIAIEDESANASEDITCGTSVTSDDGSIINSTYNPGEELYIDFGATTGSVNYVSISAFGTWTRE